MKRLINIKKETTIYILLSVLVFIYVLIRAMNMGITYDEAWTLKSFVPLSPMNIINYTPCDANNHIINTLLIKFFYFIGTENVFFARIPNVLALILYLFYSYKISKFLPLFSGLTAFVLLLINPFLLDFFSLARGYGLGLGFQITSIYYLLSFIRNKELKSANYALIFSSLAALCNFSQLNYWVASLLTLTYIAFCIHKENKLKFAIYQFIITICFALIVYEPLRKLINSHNLYYGGNSDFYSDTLVSLTKYSQYSPFINSYTHIVLNIFLLILGVCICFLILSNIRKGLQSLVIENSLFILLFLAVSSSLVQHYLLGTLYLIDRTALFYFPLFILVLCFIINLTSKVIKNTGFTFILLFFGFNFIKNANGYKTALWYFDSHTETILTWLNNKGINQNKNISIDFSWPFQSAVYHFDEKKTYPFVNIIKYPLERESINPQADYYIYLNRSLEIVGYDAANQQILKFKKDTVLSFPEEGVYVFGNIK